MIINLDILDIFEYDKPMQSLKLIPDSDPVLHQKADSVEDISAEVEPYFPEMLKLMILNRGVGLAAPQVGIKKRFFLISYGGLTNVFINPEIIQAETKMVTEIEGCLSYPGQKRSVTRPDVIKVAYTTITGEQKSHRMRGMMARIFQHELSHLNGITIMDEGLTSELVPAS